MKSSPKVRKNVLPILVASLAIPAIGIAEDKAAEKAEEKVTFQDHVFPILEDACLNCHNPDEEKGGLDLATYGKTMEGGSGGEIVQAGDPASSRILLTILHREEPFMPPKKPMLEKAQIETLTKWIEGGLLDNPNSKPRKKSVPDFAMTLSETPIGKPEGPPPMPENLLLEPVVVGERQTAVQDIATSPWAPLAALTGQNQVLLYNTDTHGLAGVLPFPEGFPQTVSFSRNGSLILAGGGVDGKSGKAVAWDVKTGKRVIEAGSEFDTVLAADISPDQSRVALGGPKRIIKVYDTRTGEEIFNLKKHPDWLLELAYSPDGKFLVSGGRSGGLYLWDAPKGLEFFTLKGHTKAITGIAWRDDSKMLATSSEDGQVILWNPADGRQIRKFSNSTPALSIHFDHAGNLVTAGRDKKGRIFDQNGKLLRAIEGFEDIVLNAAFTHDGKRVVVGDWTGVVSTHNAADSKKIGSLDGNPPSIAARLEWLTKRDGELKTAVAAAKAAYDGAVKKKADLEKKQADLSATIASMTSEQKKQAAIVTAAKAAIPNLTKEHQALAAAATATEKALAAARGEVKSMEQRLASLQGELKTWRTRVDAESKPAAPAKAPAKAAALVDPSKIILLADNSANPKIPAPKPAPKPVATPAAKPATTPAAKPVATPAAKPAPKPAPAAKPAATKPAPAAKPQEAPAIKPAPSEAQKKVAALSAELKSAEEEMKAIRTEESEAAKAHSAAAAKRDAALAKLNAQKTAQANADKASKDIAARITKAQADHKALAAPIAEAAKPIAPAKANLDKVTAELASLPKQTVFWKAASFRVEVINEMKVLDEMTLNLPEAPTAEDRAALERQKIKVVALEKHHASMLAQ